MSTKQTRKEQEKQRLANALRANLERRKSSSTKPEKVKPVKES